MPKMDLRNESRLNGAKTNIINLNEVAAALRVPPQYIIRYLCFELGTNKEKESIIKGTHSYAILLKHLD